MSDRLNRHPHTDGLALLGCAKDDSVNRPRLFDDKVKVEE